MTTKDDGLGIRCSHCGNYSTEVIDSRPATEYTQRRRRKCMACGKRTTTYEISSSTISDIDLTHKHISTLIKLTEKLKELGHE